MGWIKREITADLKERTGLGDGCGNAGTGGPVDEVIGPEHGVGQIILGKIADDIKDRIDTAGKLDGSESGKTFDVGSEAVETEGVLDDVDNAILVGVLQRGNEVTEEKRDGKAGEGAATLREIGICQDPGSGTAGLLNERGMTITEPESGVSARSIMTAVTALSTERITGMSLGTISDPVRLTMPPRISTTESSAMSKGRP